MWQAIFQRLNISMRASRRLIAGVVLLGFFLLAFAGALFLLAALQLQHELNAYAGPQGAKATIGSVREDVRYLDKQDIKQQSDADAIGRIFEARANLAAEQRHALGVMTRADRVVSSEIDSASLELPAAIAYLRMPAKIPDMYPDNNQPPYYGLAERYSSYSAMIASAAAALAPKPESAAASFNTGQYLQRLWKRIAKPMAAFNDARDEYDTATNLDQDLSRQIKSYADTGKIPGRLTGDSAYRALIDDFRAYEWVAGSIAFRIVLMPNAMLVLFLAICMGIVGSLIYLAREMVLDGNVRPAPEMLFRIGLGAAVALALYLFAAAGMVAFSQSASVQTQNDMSPYLISFLGITAGYLSDHVTAWMRQVGERTFKLEPEGEERWAIGLTAELQRQNLTTDAVAASIGEDPDAVKQWAELRRRVPALTQPVLAAYLRVHASRLFTDVNPGVAVDGGHPAVAVA